MAGWEQLSQAVRYGRKIRMDRLDGVSVFVQVNDSGNYAAAGRVLGLSASAVGKTIDRKSVV